MKITNLVEAEGSFVINAGDIVIYFDRAELLDDLYMRLTFKGHGSAMVFQPMLNEMLATFEDFGAKVEDKRNG